MLRRLERLVEEEKSPSEDPDLTFLTSLMQLAVGCRAMLRGRRFSFRQPTQNCCAASTRSS